jgi:catechol 2,3-dioxygenase
MPNTPVADSRLDAGYLRDPEGNGLELIVDRASDEWPRAPDGSIAMRVAPLDVSELVAEVLAGSQDRTS